MTASPAEAAQFEKLIAKVIESTITPGIQDHLHRLSAKIDGVHELLARRRKEHFLVEEVAELTGRSAYTIRRWISERKLHAIRLKDGGPRGKLLIPRGEMERLIESGEGAAIPPAVLD